MARNSGFKLGALAASAALLLSVFPALGASFYLFEYSSTSNAELASFSNPNLGATSVPITVTFLDADNTYGGSPTAASLTFRASTAGPAIQHFGLNYSVPVSSVSFSITATMPVDGLSNILSGTSSTGSFDGSPADFALDGQNPGDGVTFTSDFFNLSGLTKFGYEIDLGPPQPSPSVTGGVLSPFSASVASGVFSASTAPEPASVSLLGIATVAVLCRRRREV